jgi:hypothetical protein
LKQKERNMTTENEKANLPAIADDADLAALAGAARNLMTDETSLKFVKGKWKTYADREHPDIVGDTETFITDMLSYACGWVKWESKRPVHKYVFRPVDGWILPVRNNLPDNDNRTWPVIDGKKTDPWQETHKLTVKSTATGELFTWTATSWYGRKAVGRLLDSYIREAKRHPGLMPVVVLSSKDEHSTDYGDIPAPVLTVVAWETFGDGAAPPGTPLKISKTITTGALPAPVANEIVVENVEEADIEETDEGEFGGGDSNKGSMRKDMDDEIPF